MPICVRCCLGLGCSKHKQVATAYVNQVTPDHVAEVIPYDDFDALAKWALGKVAAGEMSYGRLSLLFDCVEYHALQKPCKHERFVEGQDEQG